MKHEIEDNHATNTLSLGNINVWNLERWLGVDSSLASSIIQLILKNSDL